jgi:hypothetical protein
MVITAVILQDGSLIKGNTITHLAGIRDYQVIIVGNIFIMELGTQRIATQIMAVIMDFLQDGSLIRVSIITHQVGTFA